MRGFRTHLFLVNGCLLCLGATEAAPKKLPPTLPPHSITTGSKSTTAIKAKSKAPTRKTTSKKLLPLPSTGSRLSAKPAPRRPTSVAATGRTNPDSRSVGLADARLRANASAPVFSLEEAIALTLANNPQRAEAQAAVDAATANIGAVGSQGKLQVQANGTTEYGRNTSTSNSIATMNSSGSGSSSSGDGDNGSGSGGNGSNSQSPSRSFLRFDQLTVGASLPITTGGRVKASTRQARYQAVAQIYQLAQVEQDLILSTTLAYLDVLRSDQLLRVTNANLAVSQERLRIAQLRYGVGASARLDVLRAETDLADARSRRIQAVNALGTSNSNLNILLGRAPETPIRLASINRLNLPNIAYTIKPASVLPASGRGQSSQNGTNRSGSGNTSGNTSSTTGNGTGTTGNGSTAGTTTSNSASSGRTSSGNQTNSGSGTGSPATGTVPGAVFSGPSAPAGNTSNSTIGTTNSTTPGASGNTTNQTGTVGATGATSTAGATNPTGAANPSGATTSGTGTTGGATATTGGTTATAGGGSTGTTATLGSGSGVSTGASAGLQSLAGGTRQSLAVTQDQIGAAEAAVEIAKSGKRPQLGLNLSALLRNPATFLGNFGASIGLGLAQNLFDSGRTRQQVSTAKAALAQLQARLAGQRLEVAGAIETSLLTLDSAQRRQDSADAGARSASEALRVAQVGFRSGVRTTLDLADAQAALLAAQTDAVNSRFDVADAQATLAAAVGIYTVEAQNARERAIRQQQEASEQARKQIEILQPKPKKKRKKFLGIF